MNISAEEKNRYLREAEVVLAREGFLTDRTHAGIWDLICEYRSPYDYRSWETSPFYGCVDTSRYPTFAMWYSEIVDAMQSATDI